MQLPDIPETDPLHTLLDELQRTLRDNRRFIRKLREDDADLDDGETPDQTEETEDDFEEL